MHGVSKEAHGAAAVRCPPGPQERASPAPGTGGASHARRAFECSGCADVRPPVRHNFSQVRVHTDARAAAAAAAIEARAFTVGRHIVFGAGEFAPIAPREPTSWPTS